ncbi:MAG: hypothetical protein K5856_07380 [Bacteroidaceae bacterium]|nr:hypothetical protein [Bacteroidaceae bacterium]
MKKIQFFLLLCMTVGLSAFGHQTFTAEEARRMFDEKYQMVFGDEGCTLHYAVNIIGIYKTEGTIWFKQGKSKFIDEKYIAWNEGDVYTRVDRSKRKVDVFTMTDESRDKYASKFSFEPDNYIYSAKEDNGQYVITLKAKKGVKGIKEGKCYINKATGYPESLRIKVFIFSTTIKITNFRAGDISDDTFVFPEQLYADYTRIDHRDK